MSSLDKFVDQVAKTIDDNHNKKDSKASFIFGISGRWGEGKSTFLDYLEPKLNTKGFVIVRINPWKFASDRISFLRTFLKQLSSNTKDKQGILGSLRAVINNYNELEQLDYDTSEIKIHKGWLLVIALYFILGLIVYFNSESFLSLIPNGIKELILKNWILIAAFLASTGIVAGLKYNFGKIIVTQRTNKEISTLDKFNSCLDSILLKCNTKKICIFVDDLDRVTPEIARIVLDNLRTFFDIPQLTFVVTGDHTVLERYIGEQTLPKKGESEQLEEGRRFLKKIFDVYWRLPRPILKDFQEALNDIYNKRKKKLETIFKDDQDKQKLFTYLTSYFDKNYREIIRFLDKIIFTFQIIDTQLATASEETKKYYEEMHKKPLLVVRILMFEELCSPYFEEIVRDAQLLKDMERAAGLNDDAVINNRIDSFNKPVGSTVSKLSPDQELFLRKFIKEDPRFYKGRAWDVYSITPYLSLAADSGMGDERGSLPEDFIAELRLGDSELTKKNLENSGEDSLTQDASATLNLVQGATEITEKTTYLTTILTALRGAAETVNQKPFIDNFKTIDLNLYATSNQTARLSVYDLFWKWLDKQKEVPEDYYSKFPLQNSADLNSLNTEAAGPFTSKIISTWLWGYYEKGGSDGFEKMRNILPHLQIEAVKQELNPHVDEIITSILSIGEQVKRENGYFVLLGFTEEGAQKLKDQVFDKIKKFDEPAWNWIIGIIDSNDEGIKSICTREELSREILNGIQETSDINIALTFAINKIPNNSEDLWEIILNRQVDNFVNSFPVFISNGSFNTYLPPTKYAELLFEKIVSKIESISDEEKIQWIPYLNKSVWIWGNLGDLKQKRKINSLEKSDNEGVKNAIKSVIDSWIPPTQENQE